MGETCLDRKQRGGGGGWGGRSRAKAQVAVRAVRRFRGLVEWMTRLVLATICGGGEMRTLVYYHAGRTDGRAVSEPLELWKCKCKCSVGLSSAAATNGLYAARLAHSSSSRLAGRANHGTPLASICSTAAQQPVVTELALLGRASCSIAAPLPGQRASSSSFAANSPSALLRPAPPAPRSKCSCMSHGHVRHRSLTLPRPICGRSSPAEKIKCVGRQTANVKHSGCSCFVEQHGSLNSAPLGESPAASVPTFGAVASVSQIGM